METNVLEKNGKIQRNGLSIGKKREHLTPCVNLFHISSTLYKRSWFHINNLAILRKDLRTSKSYLQHYKTLVLSPNLCFLKYLRIFKKGLTLIKTQIPITTNMLSYSQP
ncbi:hypothetical protein O6H91_05G030100 [Diphasiastrum complanatum]|uniref:Uncharacterized protein n=1 Tax=Diphasiastrum complanatum TaxID=34168 RepID=A0ACC2DMS0_DIPCM|nr:hypothetical protein O6H91_Y048300 [Diphasiastrum complanatum]KAJ7555287.1 hypothetical protein O6H91_05G030100 [Diphasiastrum complanatum]